MLDTIAILNYPDQTALVEMHSVSGDFGYIAEAAARINFYNFQGYPSLFMDGVDLWPISTWRPSIVNRMNQPSPITLTIMGDYNPATNNGTVDASFRNDSSAAITARVYFVITEDSLYHVDPNGHAWHNHLARDFLPDQTGETVTISPGETVIKSRSFTINGAWDEDMCYIVTWLQANAPSRNVFQAGEIEVMNLIGVEEVVEVEKVMSTVSLITNPCFSDDIRFSLNLPEHTRYQIEIFDILGRRIGTLNSISQNNKEEVSCNLNQGSDNITAGVYLYRFTSNILKTSGKIIINK